MNCLNKNCEVPTSKNKWENQYNLEDNAWKEIYYSPFKHSIGTQLQWFQVRINHRLLPTKSYLYKIKVTDSPRCTTCNQEETLVHMLWTCPQTRFFIQQIRGSSSVKEY